MVKSRDTLLQELNASVRSAGQGGKTTAQDLRQFLGSLVDEILARSGSEPVGTVKLFAGATAPPDWAICDGRLLPIDQYADLYAVVGTSYGGDGTTTFALPDLRGRVALGAGSAEGRPARERGEVGGTDSLTLSVDQLPSHTHLMRVSTNFGVTSDPNQGYISSFGLDAYAEEPSQYTLAPDAITNTGAGEVIPILPPFAALNYIICLRLGLTDTATSVLEFVFEAEFADKVVRTMGAYQAGEYRSQQLQNVASVAYKVNNTEAALPFAVEAGDTLEVSITRTAANQAAIVTLQN